MRRRNRPMAAARPLIDIGFALDLLAAAVAQRGAFFVYPPVWLHGQRYFYAARGGPRCLVGQAMSLAGVAEDDLVALRDVGVRDLYAQGRLPVRLTLGALAVFDAAQRGQDRGYGWGDALDYASSVAVRLLDVLPDRAFCGAGGPAEQEGAR